MAISHSMRWQWRTLCSRPNLLSWLL